MADIVNLNDRRKRKAREQKETDAAAKRLLFGRTKGEKQRETKQKDAEIRRLDGAKRDRDDKSET
jgi:superfamily I DNA and/or RNA helicase